jgi:DDE superfamily endonuclease
MFPSDSKRCTVDVTIAADGTKLEPFFIFQGVPGHSVERSIPALNVKGCCQRNGWFDELVARKWVEAIFEPSVRDEEYAFLLVDQYRVHFLASFVNACNNIGVEVDYVPKGCTSFDQPVDVGYNSLVKSHVKIKYMRWQIDEYRQHYYNNPNQPNLKLPLPLTRNIVDRVFSAYEEIPEATTRKTFLSIGFVMPVQQNLQVDNDDGNLPANNYDVNKSSDDERIVSNPQRIME